MNEIPQIVEDLYHYLVVIPDKKDWPDYLGDNELVGSRLCAFYSGLRIGAELSGALREELIPAGE